MACNNNNNRNPFDYRCRNMGLHMLSLIELFKCVIYNTLEPAVVEDIEVTLGYVHITWDTNVDVEEVTLQFIHKEKEIHSVKVTKDYYKLDMSAKWLENITKNDNITLKVIKKTSCLEMLLTIAMHHHI